MTVFYPDRESKILEFKEKVPKYNKLIKTCVAFANGAGGEIILGVRDGTREVIGLSDQEIDQLLESLPGAIYEAVVPTLIPEILIRNIKDINIAVIKIFPGGKRPYYVKSEGSKKGIYIRIGSTTRQASDDYIDELLREQNRLGYDHQACDAVVDDLAPDLVKQVYAKRVTENFMLEEQILVRDLDGKCRPSRAAVLMFCHTPERFIPEAVIICTHFRGTSGRDIIQTREITGALVDIVTTAVALIDEWTERNFKLVGARLKGQPPVPSAAIREALVNAVLHRKYAIPGAVKVAIFADRIEIFSPGAFPGLISLKNLGDGSTYLRNSLLAKFARKAGLVEKMGSGIRLIFSLCDKASLKTPEFIEDGDFVKVIFYFARKSKGQSLDQLIEEMLGEQSMLTVADVLGRVETSRNSVTAAFNRLIKKGSLRRVGSGRGVAYLAK